MIRRLLPAIAATAAIATPLTLAPAASASIDCTVTGKIPEITQQGFLAAHYSVNCTNGQSWTVYATVQADISGTWERALNTNEVTFNGSGDETVVDPVESGAWACTPGRLYRTHAVLGNGNTDNSSAITLC